jgi:hypothetical protein
MSSTMLPLFILPIQLEFTQDPSHRFFDEILIITFIFSLIGAVVCE